MQVVVVVAVDADIIDRGEFRNFPDRGTTVLESTPMPWLRFVILSLAMARLGSRILPEFTNSLFLNDPANLRAGYRKKDDFNDENARDEILVRVTFGYLTTWRRLPQSCQVESAGENECTRNV